MAVNILHFRLERFDDDHGTYYVIAGIGIALVTDGPSIEDALRNLRAAVDLYYEGDNLPQLPHFEVNNS